MNIPDDCWVLTVCEACGGEGRIEHHTGWRATWWGPEETGWVEPCPDCEGTGGAYVPAEPVDFEDTRAVETLKGAA
jgi:DnaJ-class molecular chaperone